MKQRVWLVDVDGTVALREEGGRGPYDWDRVGEDRPNEPVLEVVRALLWTSNNVLFVSGRNEVCRLQTFMWLQHHVAWGARGPSEKLMWDRVAGLLMRPDTDEWRFAPDDTLKRWLYETTIQPRYDVTGVLDDRDRVVQMWRHELGLTCLQVAEGAF